MLSSHCTHQIAKYTLRAIASQHHTIEGLRQLIFIYPSALAVVTIVAMGCFYSLNEKMYVRIVEEGNDSNLLIVFYVQIMPDDFVMQLHRF